MVQGDELRANLKNVLSMIREYENNYMQRAALENQVRGEIAEQVEMAELLECTDRHYQRMEYGYVNVPSLTLLALADYFHVTTDYLLGREDTHDHH